jgi:aminopeptidase
MTELEQLIEDYARLVVRVGVNLQPGQLLLIEADVEHTAFVAAVAREAYAAGASWVDANYTDQLVKRAFIENAPEESLTYSPPWLVERVTQAIDAEGAMLSLTGDADPNVFADLDPARVGATRMVALRDARRRGIDELRLVWCVAGCATRGWAQQVFGEPDVERLWRELARTVRLDEDDPVDAWREHVARLMERTQLLTERRFDAIRFRGPGTDLTIRLLPGSTWEGAEGKTVWGQTHLPNVPTEEVFTTPDFRGTEGVVRSTMPLSLLGVVVRGLELRFENGKIVEVKASEGADVVRAQLASEPQAPYLGEIALVDGDSRVGQSGIVFFDTLYDENAASHIAYGGAYPFVVEGGLELDREGQIAAGINVANVHTDLMIGGDDVEVDGLKNGDVVPLLRGGAWQLR